MLDDFQSPIRRMWEGAPSPDIIAPMANIFDKWKNGLAKTSKAAFGQIASLLGATEITDATFEELEALMIQADLGVDTSEAILATLWERERKEGIDQSPRAAPRLRR